MHRQKSFPLRIGNEDRRRARKLAEKIGVSENRLYSNLIQEGILMREQMAYYEKLRAREVPARAGMAILDRALDVEPAREDRLPKHRAASKRRIRS
jgi:hypothetical protein